MPYHVQIQFLSPNFKMKHSYSFNYSLPCKCHIFLLEMCVGNLLKQEKRCLIFMSNLLGRVFIAFHEVMQAPYNFFLLQYELPIGQFKKKGDE